MRSFNSRMSTDVEVGVSILVISDVKLQKMKLYYLLQNYYVQFIRAVKTPLNQILLLLLD